MALPVVDFGPFLDPASSLLEKQQVAFEIDKACREVGFFYLKNHGVPAQLVADMLAKTRHVFETATPEEKKRLAMKGSAEGGDSARGWLTVKNAAGAHEVCPMSIAITGHITDGHTQGCGFLPSGACAGCPIHNWNGSESMAVDPDRLSLNGRVLYRPPGKARHFSDEGYCSWIVG